MLPIEGAADLYQPRAAARPERRESRPIPHASSAFSRRAAPPPRRLCPSLRPRVSTVPVRPPSLNRVAKPVEDKPPTPREDCDRPRPAANPMPPTYADRAPRPAAEGDASVPPNRAGPLTKSAHPFDGFKILARGRPAARQRL